MNFNLFTTKSFDEYIDQFGDSNGSLHRKTFFLILIFAIILRIICFQGYSDSDPRDYSILADQLAKGILNIPSYEGPPVFPLRMGTYFPSAFFISLFGLSEISLVA